MIPWNPRLTLQLFQCSLESAPKKPYNILMSESDNPNTPAIRTVLKSAGGAFWAELTPSQQAINRKSIGQTQDWLMKYFPHPYRSPLVRNARLIGLQNHAAIQADNESCSLIASANALRLLDQADPLYSLAGITTRMIDAQIQTISQLNQLFSTGQPFDKFQAVAIPEPIVGNRPVPMDMYQLLRKFQDGAVGILDWPYSPAYSSRYGVNYTHARTLAGFSSTQEGLFFHVIDPYQGKEHPWSLSDLAVAVYFNHSLFDRGIGSDDIDRIARSVLIIEKKRPTGIRSASH